jgi:hypothetical protein
MYICRINNNEKNLQSQCKSERVIGVFRIYKRDSGNQGRQNNTKWKKKNLEDILTMQQAI